MKYPEKRHVQGVRPAHVVFPKVQVNFLRGILLSQAESVVADGECFPRQVGVSRYIAFWSTYPYNPIIYGIEVLECDYQNTSV